MTIFFEFTCGDCGSFEVIPFDAVRLHLLRRSPFRCRRCDRPMYVDVLYDFDPSDAAWYANALGIDGADEGILP